MRVYGLLCAESVVPSSEHHVFYLFLALAPSTFLHPTAPGPRRSEAQGQTATGTQCARFIFFRFVFHALTFS